MIARNNLLHQFRITVFPIFSPENQLVGFLRMSQIKAQ